MKGQPLNLRIEGILNMNITTELSIKSSVFGTHEDTDIGIRLIIYMMQTREEKGSSPI